MSRQPLILLIALMAAVSCRGADKVAQDSGAPVSDRAGSDSGFASVPDSAWVEVRGPTLVGFHPLATNDQLDKDADLATVLDDFAYHVGAAMDSLIAAGVTVHYRGGDTLWFRSASGRWRFVRDPDSADVGYVWSDTGRRLAIQYGVRTYVDLVADAHEFGRTGQVRPR